MCAANVTKLTTANHIHQSVSEPGQGICARFLQFSGSEQVQHLVTCFNNVDTLTMFRYR